jgi:hypothetical protein
MEKTPDYLLEDKDEGITTKVMDTLASFIRQHDTAKIEMDEAEEEFKAKKALFNDLILEQIPTFLLSHNIRKMGLTDGREVNVKEDIGATISDEVAFRKWLKDRKEEAIIRVKYDFDVMKAEEMSKLADFLCDNNYNYEVDENIHHARKAKYFRELLKTMNRKDLPEWVKIYDIRKATIKKGKKK